MYCAWCGAKAFGARIVDDEGRELYVATEDGGLHDNKRIMIVECPHHGEMTYADIGVDYPEE